MPIEVVELPRNSTLLDKSSMFEHSPFDSTLFLDSDTVVLGNLESGFQAAEQFGLACCICECPWARRYGGLVTGGDLIEYNTGVLFFTRASKNFFDRWAALSQTIDSSIRFFRDGQPKVMPINDQASFAFAMQQTGTNPFTLPCNWNFRPQWQRSLFGPLKIWHDRGEIPLLLLQFNEEQSRRGTVIQYLNF